MTILSVHLIFIVAKMIMGDMEREARWIEKGQQKDGREGENIGWGYFSHFYVGLNNKLVN